MRELARMEIPEAITALIRLTADRRLRERSVSMISKVGAAHIEEVAGGLRSPQLEVRRAVIDALGRMRHPKASEILGILGGALDDEEPRIRLAAVLALKRLGSHTSQRKLLHMAHRDPDPEVRKAAERDPGTP
jgi:HEAT repeat protein